LELNKDWLAMSQTPRPYIVNIQPVTLEDIAEMLEQTAEFLNAE
jgi:hypothetical protein